MVVEEEEAVVAELSVYPGARRCGTGIDERVWSKGRVVDEGYTVGAEVVVGAGVRPLGRGVCGWESGCDWDCVKGGSGTEFAVG